MVSLSVIFCDQNHKPGLEKIADRGTNGQRNFLGSRKNQKINGKGIKTEKREKGCKFYVKTLKVLFIYGH